MLLRKFFIHLKLGTKFNLLLLLVFVVGISLSGVVLASVLQQRAQAEVSSKALLLMETVNSVRNYTQNRVQPLLSPMLETESTFISEAIPTFSVREVIEGLRQQEDYRNFFYKDAAPNPTNLRDQADEFEAKLVERFRREPQIKEVYGFRNFDAGKVFYVARPFMIKNQQCLQCHSTPAKAPKSLLATYGTQNGFDWQLNQVVATQIISVPAEDIFNSARHAFILAIAVVFAVFTVVIVLINFLLKQAVIQRIKNISVVAHAVSMGKMDANFEEKSRDEIGALAAAFNRMKSSLEIAMKLLRQQKDKTDDLSK